MVVAAQQGKSDGQQTSTTQEGQETTDKKKIRRGRSRCKRSHAISGKTLAIVGGAGGASVAGILIAESNKKKKVR